MSPMWITILILLFVVVCFVSGKVSLSLTGSLVFLFLLVFKILPAKRVFAGFTNSSVVLFVAMFVVGAAIQKTSILTKASEFISRFKEKPQWLIVITCTITALLAIVTSGTIAVIILVPIVIGVCDEIDFPRGQILWPLAAIAKFSAGAWFLGAGALNMSWSSIMMKLGASAPLNINDFLISRLPVIIIAIIYMAFVAPKLLPAVPTSEIKGVKEVKKSASNQTLSPAKNRLAIIIILATILMMILSSYIKVDSYIIAVAGAILLVLTGVLSNKEALGAINLNIIFLVASMLSLADALSYTGAGDMIGQLVSQSVGNIHNQFLMMAVFFAVSFLVTQFLGTLPTVTILVPLITLACVKLGLDPRGAVLAVTSAAGGGFLAPIGSAVLAYVMEPGGYTIKNFLKAGLPLAILLIIFGCIVPQLMYPLR